MCSSALAYPQHKGRGFRTLALSTSRVSTLSFPAQMHDYRVSRKAQVLSEKEKERNIHMTMIQDPNGIIDQKEMRTAHLDSAHIGDIKGAWGTIRQGDRAPRRTWFARLLTLLVIMGPGLITMVGDNDAGGVQTYLQAGQNYGTTLLWTLLLLIPVLIVNQEMVVRLGAVSGVGHARLI